MNQVQTCSQTLLRLPAELLVLILVSHDDLTSLVSTVRVCRRIYMIYRSFSNHVLPLVLGRECATVQDICGITDVYAKLCSANHSRAVPKPDIEAMLVQAWPIFHGREIMALTFTQALANTLRCEHRHALLDRVWELLRSEPGQQRPSDDPVQWVV